jgi:glycosyltransferase involved in cell wall biosynthesis
MRILVVSASYFPVLGGLQTAARALARRLAEEGQQIVVVTNRYPRSLPESEVVDGISVQRWLFLRPDMESVLRGRPDLLAASLYFYPATLDRLRRLLQEFKPDVLNVHFPDGQISHVLWARQQFKFRLVVSLHGNEVERWSLVETHRGRGSARLQAILREADAVTACSRYLMSQAMHLESSIGHKAHVIPNGIDHERFLDQSYYGHPRPYILAYGRLVYKKGFDLLLRAFAQIADRHPEFDLIIAGEGEDGKQLQSLSAQYRIAHRVYFYGCASQPEIICLLNGCRLMAVPSRHEPFGIAALEAIAARRPVLATCVGGLPEVAASGPVRLVEPTVEGIAVGLSEMLNSRTQFPIASSRRPDVDVSVTSWREVARQYLQVYAGLKTNEYALCAVHNDA